MSPDEMGLSYREDEIEERWTENGQLDADIAWLTATARAARKYARYTPSPRSEIVLNAFTHLRDALSEKL